MDVSSTNPGNCVIYLKNSQVAAISDLWMAYAQDKALKNNVPLAVAMIFDQKCTNIDYLYELEKDLADLNIPLMLFIGDKTTRIEGIKKHLQPLAIISEEASPPLERYKITIHPKKWPGIVMSVKELAPKLT